MTDEWMNVPEPTEEQKQAVKRAVEAMLAIWMENPTRTGILMSVFEATPELEEDGTAGKIVAGVNPVVCAAYGLLTEGVRDQIGPEHTMRIAVAASMGASVHQVETVELLEVPEPPSVPPSEMN